jgi:hypothetical protein
VVAEASGRAFAATWRNEQGEVVATTTAKTMCLWPRLPWRIRFHSDGFEGVVPCGECPGCLELQRMRLAERLHKQYGLGDRHSSRKGVVARSRAEGSTSPHAPSLFVVRIWAPIEEHAALAHKLHRRRGLKLEPGMWRLGATSFAVLARSVDSLRCVLRSLGLKHRIEPLRLSRGRRAWRVLTAGMTVAREIYGGLPMLDRQKWKVKKIGAYESYSRARSPRATTDRNLVLVPPEIWQLQRVGRRYLKRALGKAPDPESVSRVLHLVKNALAADTSTYVPRDIGSPIMRALVGQIINSGRMSGVDRIRSNVTTGTSEGRLPVNTKNPSKSVSARRHTAASYQIVANQIDARSASSSPPLITTPTSEVGGYISSEHKQGELMPRELARARENEWREARKRKAIKDSMEIIERMKRKSRGEPGDV